MVRERLSADTRVESLLKHALNLLATKGYAGMTFQAIADACKTSQANVLYYFPKKEKIIEALIQKIVLHNHSVVSATLKDESKGLENLRRHFEGNYQWAIENPKEAQVILLLYHLATHDLYFSKLYDKILTAARARIFSYLQEAAQKKEIPPSTNLELKAEALHDALLGGIVNVICIKHAKGKSVPTPEKWSLFLSLILAGS